MVASEGITDAHGQLLNEALGAMISATNNWAAWVTLARWQEDLNVKTHVAIPDYLQRSAGHLRSRCDFDCATLLGQTSPNGADTHGVMLGFT